MFTHQIITKKFESGILFVAVQFTDGEQSFTEWFSTQDGNDTGWIKRAIKRKLQNLDALSKQEFSDQIDLTEEPAVVVDQKPENQWAIGLSKLRQMQELINLGVIDETDADYVALLKKMKKNYSPDKMI